MASSPHTTTTADASTTPKADTPAERRIRDAWALFAPLWPLVLGLAFARSGLIVSSYGSYTRTDEGMFTDGAMLMALSVMAVLLIVIVVGKVQLRKRTVNRLMRVCIAAEALTLLALAGMDLADYHNDRLRLLISAFSTLTASGAIWYWLRRVRGCSTTTAAVFVFAALMFSEVEIYLCTLIPVGFGYLAAGMLVLVQYPCMLWSRAKTQPFSIQSPTQATDYFGFTKSMIQSKQFLSATAIGIGCLSVVIGFLRGYPNGDPIAFEPLTRLAYGLLTVVICLVIVVLVLRGRQRIMTVGVFLLMEFLACWALVLYSAFPGMLDIGAILTTTLNAVMVAFTWYIVIAFMSYGFRDPYYYAIAGWLVWLGARAIARTALMAFYQLTMNDLLANAVMGGMIVVSTQVVFMQFLGISKLDTSEQEQGEQPQASAAQKGGLVSKLMALDGNESMADVRQAAMQHNVEEMGRQFLLSEREVEVLTLYAQGFTQKRVAEELFITPGTAHTHIKRIYAKTGLHSRQEILDYLQQYTS